MNFILFNTHVLPHAGSLNEKGERDIIECLPVMAAAFKQTCWYWATFPAPKQTHTHTRTKPGVHSNNAKRDASRSIYGNLWEWKCLNSIVPNGDRHSSPLLVRCGKSSTKQVTLPLAASAGSVRYWACPYGEQQSATFWRLAALVLLLTALPPARQPKPSAPAGGCRQTDNPGATTFLPRLMTHTPTSTSDIRRT